jgi:hypothetical protein
MYPIKIILLPYNKGTVCIVFVQKEISPPRIALYIRHSLISTYGTHRYHITAILIRIWCKEG